VKFEEFESLFFSERGLETFALVRGLVKSEGHLELGVESLVGDTAGGVDSLVRNSADFVNLEEAYILCYSTEIYRD
jgi:hypothetical protein